MAITFKKGENIMENGNNVDVQETAKTVEEETTKKTYTVDDVNNSYKAGVKKARAEIEESENYKKYQDWVKSNQNDGEKIKELEKSNANKDNEIKDLKVQIVLNNSDVKPEFSDFVKSEVLKRVDDTTDFDTALKQFKKDKPQYFGEIVVKKVQSSPALAGGIKSKTTNDIMNSLLRSSR